MASPHSKRALGQATTRHWLSDEALRLSPPREARRPPPEPPQQPEGERSLTVVRARPARFPSSRPRPSASTFPERADAPNCHVKSPQGRARRS
jgi:hypothetical protein